MKEEEGGPLQMADERCAAFQEDPFQAGKVKALGTGHLMKYICQSITAAISIEGKGHMPR